MTPNNPHISFLQSWGMILVVMGHSLYPPLFHFNPDFFHNFGGWIYGFHMPLWFFISGYLLQLTKGDRDHLMGLTPWNMAFLRHKFFRLIVPYILLSSIAFPPKALLSHGVALRPVSFSWHDYLRMLVMPMENVIGPYWFIPALFMVFFIVALLWRWLRGWKMALVCGVSLLLSEKLGYYNDDILVWRSALSFFVFFLLGMLAQRHQLILRLRHCGWIIGVTFILSVLLVNVPSFFGLYFFRAVTGILLSLVLSKVYVFKGWKWLHVFEGSTYTIYLLHWFVHIPMFMVLMRLDVVWYVQVVLTFILALFIPLIIHKKTKFSIIYQLDRRS